MGQRAGAGRGSVLRPVEVRLRDLPEIKRRSEFGYEYVKAGEWTLDPDEEGDPAKAWENAKAWAAYALWLQSRM